MTGLEPYREYKESGSEWLGKLPTHWDVVPSKWLFSLRAERPASDAVHLMASQKYGVISQAKFMAEKDQRVVQTIVGGDNMKRICVNDFLIHLRSFQGGIEWSANEGKVSPAYTVLRPHNGVHSSFFYYLLKSDGYIQELRATTNQLRDGQSMNYSQFAMVPLIEVPWDEQVAIANFLDRETAQIDDLIDKQERLIELLAEKRQAIITQAVTKGLDATAPTKPSGATWLEDIPEHWTAPKLSWESDQIVDGAHFTPTYVEEGVPFLRVTDIHTSKIDLETVARIPHAEHADLTRRCRPVKGDLLLSKNGTIGVPRAVTWDWDFSIFVSLCLIKLRPSLLAAYAEYVFLSSAIKSQIDDGTKQSTVSNLHLEKIRQFRIPLPPLSEQQQIVEYLQARTSKIDAVTGRAKMMVGQLLERRSALISAAVTGKIDVREEAAQL